MVYVYNPTHCMQIVGRTSVNPWNYALVTPEIAAIISASGSPLLAEGDSGFKPLFKSYNT